MSSGLLHASNTMRAASARRCMPRYPALDGTRVRGRDVQNPQDETPPGALTGMPLN